MPKKKRATSKSTRQRAYGGIPVGAERQFRDSASRSNVAVLSANAKNAQRRGEWSRNRAGVTEGGPPSRTELRTRRYEDRGHVKAAMSPATTNPISAGRLLQKRARSRACTCPPQKTHARARLSRDGRYRGDEGACGRGKRTSHTAPSLLKCRMAHGRDVDWLHCWDLKRSLFRVAAG